MDIIKRFELVMTQKQHDTLKEIAKAEQRSVSATIRVLIDKKIMEFKK